MTTATLTRDITDPALRTGPAGFGRLLRAEWTKIRSVRSTFWSLAVLVIAAVGLNTVIVSLVIAHWSTASAGFKHTALADPTGFLAGLLQFAEIPVCVFGALVITSEYSTGMIRSSVLAVPRRFPMLAAKAAVLGAVVFAVGELVAFVSFLIAQRIIGGHIPESLGDPATFRAVFGVGLYLAVLALFSFAIGAIVRHTAAAITVAVGFVLVFAKLAQLVPGSAGAHISAYLPANAGRLITHAHQEATNLLSPWQGFGVLCLWTVLLLGAATYLLSRRDV